MAKQSVEIQLKQIYGEYSPEFQEIVNDAIDKVSKEAVKKLKSESPKKTGDYARSWTVKRATRGTGIRSATVYNSKYGWKTHLLEYGHVVRNKKGEFGRAPAHSHIASVEEWANDELPKEIERKLR